MRSTGCLKGVSVQTTGRPVLETGVEGRGWRSDVTAGARNGSHFINPNTLQVSLSPLHAILKRLSATTLHCYYSLLFIYLNVSFFRDISITFLSFNSFLIILIVIRFLLYMHWHTSTQDTLTLNTHTSYHSISLMNTCCYPTLN